MGERFGDTVVFRGWEGGEYGILDPGVAGRAEKQMFTGENVLVYRSGLIGPRPGTREVATTSPPNGKPLGAGTTSTANTVWILSQTNPATYEIREWDLGTGTVSSAYSGTIPDIQFAVKSEAGTGINTWINALGYGVYNLDHTADSISLTSSDPAGLVISQYGLRTVANNGPVLWFSDANDPDTYDATSYVELSGFSISFLAPFRDGLIVGTAGGIFNMITGVLGATTVVRELSRGGAPVSPFHSLRVADDKIWYFNSDAPYPSMFNGSVHQRYDYLAAGAVDVFSFKLPSQIMNAAAWVGTDDWVSYSESAALCYLNGVFTKHTTPFGPLGAVVDLGTHHLLVESNGTGVPLSLHYFAPGANDRPAFTTDDYGQPGDGSDTPLDAWFSTPEWWDDEGHEVRVAQVIVDYTGWDTGATGDTVGVDVVVHALHRTGGTGSSSSSLMSEAQPMSDFSTDGTVRRAAINIGGFQYGGGFQISLSSIQNCAIKSITAVMTQDPRRV